MDRRDEILDMIPEIPALPSAAGQVLALIEDPSSGIAEIMDAMEQDPGLTAEVLRLANSSFFAGPRKIGNLRDAGVYFGAERIRQLVLASAVIPMARKPVRGYGLSAGQLFEHLLAVGIGVEELAQETGVQMPPHAFTAGLLHDIGKIVLGTFVEVDAAPILKLAHEEKIPFDQAEREVLGIDHTEAGEALLDAWNFPETILRAVRWHHEPEQLAEVDPVVDIVHVCNLVSIETGIGAGIDGLNYRPSRPVLERLGLSSEMIEKLTCAMFSELRQMSTELDQDRQGD